MIDTPPILQFSPGRSGSTLVHQALRILFDRVRKSHEYHTTDETIVAAYRHPFGVFLSIYRVFADADNYDQVRRRLQPMGILAAPRTLLDAVWYVKLRYGFLRRYYRRHGDKALYLRYEAFVDHYDHLFARIEKFFNITIDPQTRRRIEQATSADRNRRIAAQFDSFMQFDRGTGIHGKHIAEQDADPQQVIPYWMRLILEYVLFAPEIRFYRMLGRKYG